MSRATAEVLAEWRSLLPLGWIWPRSDDSLMAELCGGPAERIAVVEATAEAMMEEVDPRTATLCLTDFERVLGADPCGRDIQALGVSARQGIAHQRWVSRGGQSIAYFVEIAAQRGVTIRVVECHPSRAGAMRAGERLVNTPEQFVWVVELQLGAWDYFKAGQHRAGDRLYMFDLSDIECDIRRVKPAHTEVVFSYIEDF